MKQAIVLLILLLSFKPNHAQTLYFPPNGSSLWDTLDPASLGYCQNKIDSLYQYLEINNTKAFILLKDGKIVLEKYFGTHTATTPWQWASAAKTITATLIGIAQQENYLSIQDTTSQYLGQGWTACMQAQEDNIKIIHQLSMTSGLDDAVPDNFCTLDTCLVYKANAGTRWAYHNAPYTLLDSVIANATGQTLNAYTTLKIKNPTGMTGSFVKVGFNNVFYSNARSMARFGLLILNKGNWNGTPVLSDTNYFNQMTNTSQALNPAYGYLWWLNGKNTFMIPNSQLVFPGPLFSNAPSDMISAMGKGGQFLNIVPSQQLVWLRMGDEPGNSLVPFLLNDSIWRYVNQLVCNPNATSTFNGTNPRCSLYPNPAKNHIMVNAPNSMTQIALMNLQGQCVRTYAVNAPHAALNIDDLPDGFYFLRITMYDGQTRVLQWMKQTKE